MSRIAAVLLSFSLAACGMKGPLELPPGAAPEPLLGSPKAAKPAPRPSAGDVSTDLKSSPQ
ncbi:LPS translocon maturation chaperone LptM [Dechloromonas sp. A34]|uniref:LPS translocon maturation chaperone LptM n=1 Tax=Dechloromonas sp. A34 TaxID=447588 RepID=UPI003A521D0A